MLYQNRKQSKRLMARSHLKLRIPLIALTLCIAFFVSTSAVYAGTYYIDTNDDATNATDINPGDCICLTDDADCTLRAAIQEASACAGADTIYFDADIDMATISLTANLPAINDSGDALTTITTEGGVTYITIDSTGAGVNGNGFAIEQDNVTIDGGVDGGIRLVNGQDRGILGSGSNITLDQLYIGTDGTSDLGFGNRGISLTPSGSIYITDSVVSGNTSEGIRIDGGTGHLLTGNKIGTNAAGTSTIGNGWQGIGLIGSNSTIGGAGDLRNIIGGNGFSSGTDENATGIMVSGNGNTIRNNLIGVGPNNEDIGNNKHGIHNHGGSDNNTYFDNIIGNQNHIADGFGIDIEDPTATGLQIYDNLIGVDSVGSAAPNYNGILLDDISSSNIYSNTIRFNTTYGVSIGVASSTTLGGTIASDANVISSNGSSGVYLNGCSSDSSNYATIQGNYIGTNAGDADQSNGTYGVEIGNDCSYSLITGNTIAYHNDADMAGVYSGAGTSSNNTISYNTVHDNEYGVLINTSGNNTINGNDIYDNDSTGDGGAGIMVQLASGNEIYDNDVYNNNNSVSGFGLGVALFMGDSNAVYRNDLYGNDFGFIVYGSDDETVYNNFIYSNSSGCGVVEGSDNTLVANNSFYQNGGAELNIGGFSMADVTNTTLANNIISTNSTGINFGNSVAGGFSSDYNVIYSPGGANAGYWEPTTTTADTLAEWYAASGQDNPAGNSIEADPLFAGAPSDLHLLIASPAINEGVDLTASGITDDYDAQGRPWLGAGSYDIGADERNGPLEEEGGDAVPEFSLLTLVLAFGLGLGTFGFVRIRKR
ncbi:MAG: right-handed parallel beta-helix repeat-containing protein [Candidatus Kerfeldbacteria bacterium]